MKSPQERRSKAFADTLNSIYIVVSAFFALFLSNYIGSDFNTDKYVPLLVGVIVVVLVIYLLLALLIEKCNKPIKLDNPPDAICDFTNNVCCGKLCSRMMRQNYNILPSMLLRDAMEKHSFYFQDDIIRNEELEFYKKKGDRSEGSEIWILSPNLTEGATSVVDDNLQNGIPYRYFYSKTLSSGEDNFQAKESIRLMNKILKGKSNLSFYHYTKEKDEIDAYLFDMFEIMIYISKDGERRAYFSIRHLEKELIPIYLKMPWCMATRYYIILEKIKKEIDAERGKLA